MVEAKKEEEVNYTLDTKISYSVHADFGNHDVKTESSTIGELLDMDDDEFSLLLDRYEVEAAVTEAVIEWSAMHVTTGWSTGWPESQKEKEHERR